MTKVNANLRKAAVFIRSLDADTASVMLAQLSPEEAAALRAAIRSLGALDPDEQADVVAEFRHTQPLAIESPDQGVELALTSSQQSAQPALRPEPQLAPLRTRHEVNPVAKRFTFLDQAPIESFVPYLSREHAQTIAVVLSHLPPRRAAEVLAALPEKLQAETLERLSAIGEIDPESVVVVESELADWLANRNSGSIGAAHRHDAVASVLAAADAATRSKLVSSLRSRNAALADRLSTAVTRQERPKAIAADLSQQAAACAKRIAGAEEAPRPTPLPARPVTRMAAPLATFRPAPLPRFDFDDLPHLDNRLLTTVLAEVNAAVLVLALAGSKEELKKHVLRHLPKRVAKAIRQQLRRLGPTRLSDVEAAQRAIALAGSRHLATARMNKVAAVT